MGRFSVQSRRSWRAPLILIFAALTYSGRITAQDRLIESRKSAEQQLEERGELIIRFIKPAEQELEYYTALLSIDNVKGDTVIAYANKIEFRQFLALNIPYDIMQVPSLKKATVHRYKTTGDWHDHFPSYPAYIALMDSFSRNYPNLCRLTEIGKSVNNHRLLAIKISDHPEIHEKEPVVFLSSTIHGDEPLGFYLMLRMTEELLGKYGSDDQIKRLVDSTEIWINPLANPDGTYFLSDNSVTGATRFNANQVDLNRNFPDPVKGDHPDSYGWQSETVAMMSFMKNISPVLAANFHSGSEVVNYPWDALITLHADDTWYKQISHAYADTAQAYGPPGYMSAQNKGITNGYQWYVIHGGRQDYVNYFLHGREVTIELSDDKLPDETSLDDYWNYNRKSLFQYVGQVFTGVTGEVTDSVTGLPVNAIVSIPAHDRDNSQVYSEPATGNYYRLTGTGSYTFVFSAQGYTQKGLPVVVTNGNLTRLDAKLSPMPGNLLYPNPFTSVLYYNADEAGEELILEFFDLSGRRVKRITQPVLVAGKQEIPVTGLAAGLYIVSISYKKQTTREVVVRKY